MSQADKKRIRTRAEMYPLVVAFLQSGLSRKGFCRDHGIAASTFLYWEELYLQEGKPSISSPAVPSGFIPMEVGPPAGVGSSSPPYALEVELGSGHKLRFGILPSVAWLKELGIGC